MRHPVFQFVGGPWDGSRRVIDDGGTYPYIMVEGFGEGWPEGAVPAWDEDRLGYREHRYRPVPGTATYEYVGPRETT